MSNASRSSFVRLFLQSRLTETHFLQALEHSCRAAQQLKQLHCYYLLFLTQQKYILLEDLGPVLYGAKLMVSHPRRIPLLRIPWFVLAVLLYRCSDFSHWPRDVLRTTACLHVYTSTSTPTFTDTKCMHVTRFHLHIYIYIYTFIEREKMHTHAFIHSYFYIYINM